MILTGPEIEAAYRNGRVHISPFEKSLLNPNSYNFRLGPKLLTYDTHKKPILDSRTENPTQEITIPEEGLTLLPGILYLGHTLEEIGSDYYVPEMAARSSVGRLGIFIYLNSGLGDIGFKHQWTLELSVVHPVKVYPEMTIGQMKFLRPVGEISHYRGKYQGSVGPVASKLHLDRK